MYKPDSGQSEMLLAPFRCADERRELIGVEIEAGVVDPATGVSRPYDGERGMMALLSLIADRWDAMPSYQGTNLIGLRRADGTEIGLESGGALEYVSTAELGLADLVEKANNDLQALSRIADELDLAMLSGAMLPFDTAADLHWMPKPRIPLMLDHFRREVGPASQGWAAMAQIMTIQTTIDFLDADDLARKHRMANCVSPFVAALFVNSPIHQGHLTDFAARRMQIWANVDARRVGFFAHSFKADVKIEDVIDWVLGQRMIFRVVDGSAHAAPHGKSFASYLAAGYGDGTSPVLDDWVTMLSTTWPYVRLRDTLELRIADGPFQSAWTAAPALWTGLAYDPQACEAAWQLTRRYELKNHLDAVDDIAMRGLDACIAGEPVRPLCAELLTIAQEGLSRRVKDGVEAEAVLTYLNPLFEITETGETFAIGQARRWKSDLAQDPRRYVEAYRYR